MQVRAQASTELAMAQQAAQKLARRLRSLRAERAALDPGALASAALHAPHSFRECFTGHECGVTALASKRMLPGPCLTCLLSHCALRCEYMTTFRRCDTGGTPALHTC